MVSRAAGVPKHRAVVFALIATGCDRCGAPIDSAILDDTAPLEDTAADLAGAVIEAMVHMRDGTLLYTEVHLPDVLPDGGVPVVLEREPYGYVTHSPVYTAAE